MKKSATAVLLIPVLVCCVFLLDREKPEHGNSPAFSVALERAVSQLEGAAGRVTASVVPKVRAGALDLTTDPITCDGAPECTGLTQDARPCVTLVDQEPTCDAASPTCNAEWTCKGAYTCDSRETCNGEATCDADITCWNSTCGAQGLTCDGMSPTCIEGSGGCDFTYDGTHTCNQSQTCFYTCESWPTICSATCTGPTCEHTCEPTCSQYPTCEGGETCDGTETCQETCEGFYTCDVTCEGNTCDGTGTCDGTETCENTCSQFPGCEDITTTGFTCDGTPSCVNTCSTYPTCQAVPQCGITYDGTPTCDGGMTCSSTCTEQWPTCGMEKTCAGYGIQTCDPGDPQCSHATEHTSWGKLKKQFK